MHVPLRLKLDGAPWILDESSSPAHPPAEYLPHYGFSPGSGYSPSTAAIAAQRGRMFSAVMPATLIRPDPTM